jgi:DNA-binding SARP family transcriptional activator
LQENGMLDGSATTGGALRFQLLGPVRAWRGERQVDLGSPQQVAVACVLLMHGGRPVTTQQLIDALWGEEPPPRAMGALRTYISRLRAVIEPERPARAPAAVLVSVPDGYALRVPAEAVDVLAFERAVEAADESRAESDHTAAHKYLHDALALWDGVPLAGVTGPYAESTRERLEQRRLYAQELRLESELALGRAAETVAELTVLVAEHPLRESLRGLLMLALYRSGRQAEALGVYTDTRRLLIEELGVEPGPELAALHARMLDGDLELAPPAAPADPVQVPLRPAQLPTDIADFTGRSSLVEELMEALRNADVQAVAISALAGIGGVGKTTLAVHAAHLLRGEFPDGQLYADLRGAGASPADPGTVLGDFLRSLGVPAREIPDGTEARSALYRTLLADRRVLVMLDNARDPAQVRPLLPGTAGCSVVITSRARMAGLPGVRPFDVDVLEEAEALDLFAAIAGAERVAAEPQAARDVLAGPAGRSPRSPPGCATSGAASTNCTSATSPWRPPSTSATPSSTPSRPAPSGCSPCPTAPTSPSPPPPLSSAPIPTSPRTSPNPWSTSACWRPPSPAATASTTSSGSTPAARPNATAAARPSTRN